MFDLDIIEKDWKDNSFCLSEEEIIDIYRSENITLSKYDEQIEEYLKNKKTYGMSAEERLLLAFFGNDKEIMEREKKFRDENPFPIKKRLSKELQNRVVEGSLYIVFDSTRYWYNFFNGKLSMEKIYYVCLEALINSVKYMVHCEKPVFRLYVVKSIERNIIKYVARLEHISYRKVYEIIHNYFPYDDFNFERSDKNKLFTCFDSKEDICKPSKIFYELKDEYYDINYIKNVSSEQFMKDYIQSLNKLNELEKLVMQLSYDIEGNRGLTNSEIAEYLGIDLAKISTIRKNAIKIFRKDKKLNMYR